MNGEDQAAARKLNYYCRRRRVKILTIGNTVVLKSDLVKRKSVYKWYARTANSRVILSKTPGLTRLKLVVKLERNPSSVVEVADDECVDLMIINCDRRLLSQLLAEAKRGAKASTGKLGAVTNVEADLHVISARIELWLLFGLEDRCRNWKSESASMPLADDLCVLKEGRNSQWRSLLVKEESERTVSNGRRVQSLFAV